jgi:hypothetical protein
MMASTVGYIDFEAARFDCAAGSWSARLKPFRHGELSLN